MQRIKQWIFASRLRAIVVGLVAIPTLCCACLFCIAPFLPPVERTPTATPARLATLALPTEVPTLAATITKPAPTLAPPTETASPVPTETPAPPTPTRGPTFTVVEFRSPVPVNGTARLVIRATPGAFCFINYRTPSGNVSDAQGLENKTADTNGLCVWEWEIGRGTNPGTGAVIVSVDNYTESLPIVIQ